MDSSQKSEEFLNDAVVAMSKQPFRKLEFALKRISKVVSVHLEFLSHQKCNIERYQHACEWDKLHAEQINASRTVQQLKADIYELEIVGQQIIEEDLPKFEAQAHTIKEKILSEIAAFVGCHSETTLPCTALRKPECSTDFQDTSQPLRSPTPPLVQFSPTSTPEELFLASDSNSTEILTEGVTEEQLQKVKRSNSTVLRSWDHLKKEIVDLNSLITGFANSVRAQRASIAAIESHTESTHDNVYDGAANIKKAAGYKLSLLPLSGAVLGGILGGPIGLVAGFKVAAVGLALGGGVIGFTGGRILQKKRYASLNSENSVELEDMSTNSSRKLRNSLSLNDLKE